MAIMGFMVWCRCGVDVRGMGSDVTCGELEEHRYEYCAWTLGGARVDYIRTDYHI